MVTLTERAVLRVKEMLSETEGPETFLRIGVNEGGCTGFSYDMGFDVLDEDRDILLNQEGVQIVIERAKESLLKGTNIDYQESLMGGGFIITNPNASLTCGCGASFRTATDSGKPGDC